MSNASNGRPGPALGGTTDTRIRTDGGHRTGSGPRVSTDYTYRGIDAAILENRSLRVVVLTGKGGDLVEFRDKRTDVDVLWRAPHNWSAPRDRSLPSDPGTTWNEHYPGGWQVNLPVAGDGMEIPGGSYGLHGESALLPWDATTVRTDDETATLRLEVDLVRYPFRLERELTLPAGHSRLEIDESVTNLGGVSLEYVWQHHVALGQPLLSAEARLDVPEATGVTPEYGDEYPNGRLTGGKTFEWPAAPAADGETIDLRKIPPAESTIHDMAYAVDLADGWYAVTNPDLDLGFALQFPLDPFETLWYWQAFGGYHRTPWFNRNYNVGLEPTTAYPATADGQRSTDTMDVLEPGETVDARFTAVTYGGYERVTDVGPDGTVTGE